VSGFESDQLGTINRNANAVCFLFDTLVRFVQTEKMLDR